MAEYTPQEKVFRSIDTTKTISTVLFVTAMVLSVLTIMLPVYGFAQIIIDVINIVNILCIPSLFILELVTQYVLTPQAESIRQDDFIDNSLGSKFSITSSKSYYDNDEIQEGVYKVAVNLFENCFFTLSLLQLSTIRKIIFPTIGFISLLICTYYGFKDVPIALTILQAFLSANVLGSLVRHLVLVNQLTKIQENWITLFQGNSKEQISKDNLTIHRCWLKYESLINRISPEVPKSVFTKNNADLTIKWTQLKNRYNIS